MKFHWHQISTLLSLLVMFVLLVTLLLSLRSILPIHTVRSLNDCCILGSMGAHEQQECDFMTDENCVLYAIGYSAILLVVVLVIVDVVVVVVV